MKSIKSLTFLLLMILLVCSILLIFHHEASLDEGIPFVIETSAMK